MDGKVVIDVELGTKTFEKQIKRTELELQKMQKQYDFLTQINERRANSQEKTYKFTAEEYQALHKLDLTMDDIGSNKTFNNLQEQIEKTTNKLVDLNKKQNELNVDLNKKQNELNKEDNTGIANSLKNIGNSMEGIIKKVTRWGLAVFGVRSAYMFIRQAMSTLSQYDDKLATDIQYIRYALASALKPIIETIINLIYKLLAYIGYIAKEWFGINLFANASAKAFQKVNKGVKDTNKSAKQLQKTLAGFDEMNILQENGSVGTGGGGGGVGLPTQDLSDLGKIKIPEWLDWIVKHKDIVIGFLEVLGILLISIKYGLHGIIAVGIGIALISIVNLIKDVIELVKNPSWTTFKSVLQDLEGALIGVGIALVAINTSNPVGWVMLGIAGITKLIEVMGDAINKDEEKIKTTKTLKEAEKDLSKTRNALKSATQNYKNATKEAKKAEKELTEIEKKHKISGKDLYDQVLTGQLTYDKMTKSQKTVYEAYLNNLEAQGNLKTATEKMQQATIDERNAIEDLSVSTYKYKGQYSDYVKTILDNYDKQKIGAEEMASKIMYVMSEMDKDTREKFAIGLPKSVKDGFLKAQNELGYGIRNFSNGVKISFKDVAYAGESATKRIGDAGKSVADKLSKQFGTTIPNNIQKSIDKINTLTQKLGELGKSGAVTIATTVRNITGKGNAKGAIYYPPKLAVGGIINQPGRGVPLAMGGERGAEGVIPLTDSQQMNLLGEAIGKYITVNATIVNQMNGRVISRELKQIQNDEDFAFNGG